MSDVLETLNSEDGQWRVEVWPDYDCSSPREDGVNLGSMFTWDRNYNSPDEHGYADPEEFEEWWNGVYNDGSSRLDAGEIAPKDDPRYVRLPVIKYEHSGVAYSTGRAYPFNDRWDSCQVGWIFSTPTSLEETGAPLESVADQLKEEVAYYSK